MKNFRSVLTSNKRLSVEKIKRSTESEVCFKIKAMLFLLLSSFSLSAQDGHKTWGLEVYYTPQYSDYLFSDFLQNDDLLPAYSYSIGLGFEKDIAKKWAINVGLVFQKVREKDALFSSNQLRDQVGNGFAPITESPGREVEYFTIGIPLTTKLFIQKKRFRWYCRTGIQPEIEYLASRASSNFNPNPNPIRTEFNKINVSWVLAFGMDVRLTNFLTVFVEPEGKANIIKLDNFFDTRRYLGGVRVGVRGDLGRKL